MRSRRRLRNQQVSSFMMTMTRDAPIHTHAYAHKKVTN